MLKNLPHTLVGLGRAFEVFVSTNLLPDILTLLRRHRLLRRLGELLNRLLIPAEILFAADENDGQTRAEMEDFGDPLFLHIVKRIGRINGEADQNDMRIGVGEWAETVVVFLTSRIPKGEFDVFAIDFNVGNVVFEDGRHVDLGKSSF